MKHYPPDNDAKQYPTDNDADWYVIPMIVVMLIVMAFLLWRFGMYLPSTQ